MHAAIRRHHEPLLVNIIRSLVIIVGALVYLLRFGLHPWWFSLVLPFGIALLATELFEIQRTKEPGLPDGDDQPK